MKKKHTHKSNKDIWITIQALKKLGMLKRRRKRGQQISRNSIRQSSDYMSGYTTLYSNPLTGQQANNLQHSKYPQLTINNNIPENYLQQSLQFYNKQLEDIKESHDQFKRNSIHAFQYLHHHTVYKNQNAGIFANYDDDDALLDNYQTLNVSSIRDVESNEEEENKNDESNTVEPKTNRKGRPTKKELLELKTKYLEMIHQQGLEPNNEVLLSNTKTAYTKAIKELKNKEGYENIISIDI